MKVYRIARKKRIADLSGLGAKLAGGRWNPKDFPVLYTASNSSLAILEKLVHVDFDLLPDDLYLAEIEIEGEFSQKTIETKKLPRNWNNYPNPDLLKKIGETWLLENQELVLKVPSAVNVKEYNYLINPAHIEFPKVKLLSTYPFKIDDRLTK
jgi:RES domain-containing protein